MNNKISTGYLTPQASRVKKTNHRRSESLKQTTSAFDISDSVFEKIMSDPIKRRLVQELINDQKDAIEEYKRNEAKKKAQQNDSLGRVQKKPQYESPTALFRRRALEKHSSDTSSERSDSRQSLNSLPSQRSSSSSPIPTENLLGGIIAYVEIKSNDQDRSDVAKSIMRLMGAEVRDTFTKDVTHVVFKDGSFTTFQRAKLKKVHLVSVLWLEAVRRKQCRVPEKNYPALGTEAYDHNVSAICSQMQKEYEDVIREEIRRSLHTGTPLPTTKSLIHNRRRTICSQQSSSLDREMERIFSQSNKKSTNITGYKFDKLSPELTSDESDCGGIINGVVTKNNSTALVSPLKKLVKPVLQAIENVSVNNVSSDMDLTNNDINNSTNSTDKSKSLVSYLKTPRKSTKKTEENINLTENEENVDIYTRNTNESRDNDGFKKPTETPKEKSCRRRTRQLKRVNKISDDSTDSSLFRKHSNSNSIEKNKTSSSTDLTNLNLSDNSSKKKPDSTLESTMSSLRLSPEKNSDKSKSSLRTSSEIFDNEKSNKVNNKSLDSTTSQLQSSRKLNEGIKKTKNKPDNSVESYMSSLRLSSENNNVPQQVQTVRRSARISRSNKFDSFGSNESFTPNTETVNNIIEKIDNYNFPEDYITFRRGNNRKNENSLENDCSPPKKAKSDSDENSGNKKRRRKLYNPDDLIEQGIISDEQERIEKRKAIIKQKTEDLEGTADPRDVFINITSNILLTAKAKQFVDENNINLQSVLDKDLLMNSDEKNDRKQVKTKKQKNIKPIDNSRDEQVQLADEFVNKKNTPSTLRKSTRKTNVKPYETSQSIPGKSQQCRTRRTLNFNTDSDNDNIPISPIRNRRSTMEFQVKKLQSSQKKKVKADMPTIVCTKMHRPDIEVFRQIVRKLGGFVVEDEVSKKTTHLVAGESKRTINMLRAVCRGGWILKQDWLFKSLENGKWLPEEDYEVTDFSPAVQQCRLQRQAFGPSFSMDVFQNCGLIYVTTSSIPRCSDLRELIILCKGKVTTIKRNAEIVVGEFVNAEGVICVKEIWILDSITFNKKMPLKKYLLKGTSTSPVV